MKTTLKDTPLSVALALQGKPEGFIFRTKDKEGAVRAYKVLVAYPLSVGKAFGSGFVETNEILGEFYLEGLGAGFPTISNESSIPPAKTRHSHYPEGF